MNKALLYIGVVFFALFLNISKTKAAAYTWNGAGVTGGTASTNFSTAANWKVGGATPATGPGASDDVTMNFTDGTSTIVTVGANTTIKSFTVIFPANNNAATYINIQGFNFTVTGATSLSCTSGNPNSSLAMEQSSGSVLTFDGSFTCTGAASNKGIVFPFVEVDGGNGAVYINGNWTCNTGVATASADLPATLYFDGTGTQTITCNESAYYVVLPSATQVGNANNPTVIISAAGYQGVMVVNSNLTVQGGATLILQEGAGGNFGGALNAFTSTGTFTLHSLATLEVQDNNGAASAGTGVTGSNFPGNYGSYSLHSTSTTIYNPTITGTSQTVYSTTYGNLSITNASGSGSTTATAGGTVTVVGDMLISPSSIYAGSTQTTKVAGDWTNNGTFTYNTSTVQFNGSVAQALTGTTATTFYNLTLTNTNATTYIGEVFGNNATVANTLTFSSTNKGDVNLNGNNLTIGLSAGTAGSISYPNPTTIAGWVYGGGNFTRWVNSGSTIALPAAGVSTAGFFPIGSAPSGVVQGFFEPFWFGASSAISTGGTLTISQGSTANGSTAISPTYVDASWTKTVAAISNASWTLSNSGVAFATANTQGGEVAFGGNAFGIFLTADINASYAASTTETYKAPLQLYGATDFEVERTALKMSEAAATWYIGTSDTVASPLPVSLTYFTAECNNYYAVLKWSTASESNNDHYTVERTQDGYTYETVAVVKGAGTTSETSNYSTIDDSPLVGTSYYRLSQTDIDGTTKNIGDAVYVPCENEEDINAFASNGNNINLRINATEAGSYQVNLINEIGQVVFGISKNASTGLNEYKIQTQVANGIYFLQVIGNNKVYTHKLVLGRS